MTFSPSNVEIHVFGTTTPLTSLNLNLCPGHASVPADSWLLNTTGQDHHGDIFNSDGGTSDCGSCHSDYWRKPPAYGNITPSRAWCFRCHNGAEGVGPSFVDPTQ